ncbi:MAG: chemotaxis protein CheB [Myxococcota bacterium]
MKVLVVDDSPLMRSIIHNILHAAGHHTEVAENGAVALEMVKKVDPDVLTMDVEMPVMGGLECLERLMATDPRPVVMLSTLTAEGAETALTALELGAVDVMGKPRRSDGGLRNAQDRILAKVEAAATAQVRRRGVEHAAEVEPDSATLPSGPRLVVIGASTGGPPVVSDLLTCLPADYPLPIVVALHMPEGFTGRFVARMARKSRGLRIVEVTDSMPIEPGTAYLAPGGRDLEVTESTGRLVAHPRPIDEGSIWHPGVGRLVTSAMEVIDPQQIVSVMLTGMGDDGAAAMAELRRRGGLTVAESRDSAVIFGMPGALVEASGASLVLHRDQIRAHLKSLAQRVC